MVASVPTVIAVTAFRRRRPDAPRPFRMWLYPLPSIIAMCGWIFVIATSGWEYITACAVVIVAGVAAYFWRASVSREWPFEQRETERL